MDEKSREQHRRLWIIIVAALLIPVILLGLYVVVTRNSVERRLQALRDAGYPTSLAEWAEMHKLPDGVPNAAKIYEQAFKQIVYPVNDGNIPVMGQAALPDRGEVWSEAMLRDVGQCLQDNHACLDLLYQAAEIDQCRYNWEYMLNMPDFSRYRRCAFLLDLEMLFHAQRDQVDALVPCFRCMLSLNESLRREPTMLPYLVRMAVMSMALRGLEWTLNTVSLTDRQLQDLDEMLAREATSFDLTEVIISERCGMIELFQEAKLLASYTGRGGVTLEFPGAMATGLLDVLDHTADSIEAMKLPPVERLARFKAIDAKQANLPFWHVITNKSPQTLAGICMLDLRLQASLILARTALAIERYRLVTGNVPERLDVLIPKYVDAVPIDPFDGQPIRFQATKPGYLIYSVNDDVQDDGGKDRDRSNPDATFDLRFIVIR